MAYIYATVFGVLLWTAYGILQEARALIGSNSVCRILSASIIAMKLLPDRETEQASNVLEPVVGKDEPTTAQAWK